MILVLTGFHPVPFDRLISAMDEIAGQIEEEVVIQCGESKIEIKHAKYMKYAGFKDNEELIKSARIVVSHAGVGTILDCKRLHRKLAVVPRRMELGESYDDHQYEIAETLGGKHRVMVAENIEDLRRYVDEAGNIAEAGVSSERARLIASLRRLTERIDEELRQ